MKSLLQLFFLRKITSLNDFAASDSLLIQHVYAVKCITIPKGVEWYLNSCFISLGSAYNIPIVKQHFKLLYKVNNTLLAPQYIPEMKLITDKTIIHYTSQFNFKK
jgi:hypothetical protein